MKLREMLDKGWTVKISPIVNPDEVFTYEDPESGHVTVGVHPLTYSYLAYPWQEAHEINKKLIQQKIDAMAADASKRLDAMVDYMNKKHDPVQLVFMPGVEVEEKDGLFTFTAVPYTKAAEGMKRLGSMMLDATGSVKDFVEAYSEPVEPAYLERGSYLGDRIRYGQMLQREQENLDAMENRSYSELEEHLGRKPDFDEIVRGY